MKPVKIMGLIILAMIGTWLALWDFIDWLTQGLNENVWNNQILINGFPSIALGVTILIICGALGISVLRG